MQSYTPQPPEVVIPDELLPWAHHPLPRFLLILLLRAIFLTLLRLLPAKRAARKASTSMQVNISVVVCGRLDVPLKGKRGLLCDFGHAVHVVSGYLLRHHTAHRQLQLQQRRPQPVVLRESQRNSKISKTEKKRPRDESLAEWFCAFSASIDTAVQSDKLYVASEGHNSHASVVC